MKKLAASNPAVPWRRLRIGGDESLGLGVGGEEGGVGKGDREHLAAIREHGPGDLELLLARDADAGQEPGTDQRDAVDKLGMTGPPRSARACRPS